MNLSNLFYTETASFAMYTTNKSIGFFGMPIYNKDIKKTRS